MSRTYTSRRGALSPRNLVVLATIGALFLIPLAIPAPSAFASVGGGGGCVPAGGTGLTAKVVVWSSHTVISGKVINAAGCDVGIYVKPGTSDVRITGNTITGANDHGVLVQDSYEVSVDHNFVTLNGQNGGHSCNVVAPPACIPEDKGIQFVGTAYSTISNNVVSYNNADGGIGVTDDNQTFNPAALMASSNGPHRSHDDAVKNNNVFNNLAGCGIVISGYDAHVGVRDIWVVGNTVIGSSPEQVMSGAPPYIGQIVVAADGPFVPIFRVHVLGNTIADALLPGIVVHSNVFGDRMVNITLGWNVISNTGFYPPEFATPNVPVQANGPTGISLVAEVGIQPPNTPNPVLQHTVVISNTILSVTNGVWLCGTTHTFIGNLKGNAANPVVTCAAGGH